MRETVAKRLAAEAKYPYLSPCSARRDVQPVLARSPLPHSPKRTEAKISKGQAEAGGDHGATGALATGLVFCVLARKSDPADPGHRQENKARNLEPELPQNTSERTSRGPAGVGNSGDGTAATGLLGYDPRQDSELPR